jgi:hypothetical protein
VGELALGVGQQEVGAGQSRILRQPAERLRELRLEARLASSLRRKPDGGERRRDAPAKTLDDAALAADHAEMMRHHPGRPWRRRVEPASILFQRFSQSRAVV